MELVAETSTNLRTVTPKGPTMMTTKVETAVPAAQQNNIQTLGQRTKSPMIPGRYQEQYMNQRQLYHTNMPNIIPGIEAFKGKYIHTAKWDPSVIIDVKKKSASSVSGGQVTVEAAKISKEVRVKNFNVLQIMFCQRRSVQILKSTLPVHRHWANRMYRNFLSFVLDVVMLSCSASFWDIGSDDRGKKINLLF